MSEIKGKAKARLVVTAKVIRKDGAVEDLGVIAESAAPVWSKIKKLFGVMGLYLGLKGIIFNIFFSCFFGAIITIALIVSKKIKRDQAIAFGPFIILTACLQMFLPDFFAQMVNALLF